MVLHLTVEAKPVMTDLPALPEQSEDRVAQKILYNGRIYIIRKDENTYDILGNQIY